VDALRAAAMPQNPSWFAYKMSEPSSRDVVRAALARLTVSISRREYLHDERRHRALLVTMTALTEAGDEVIFIKPPWFFYEKAWCGWRAGLRSGSTSVRHLRSRRGRDQPSNHGADQVRDRQFSQQPDGKIYPPRRSSASRAC